MNPTSAMCSTRGHFEYIGLTDHTLHIRGWILVPAHPLHSAVLSVNSVPTAEAPLMERPDVAAAIPQIRHSMKTGFDFRIPGFSLPPKQLLDLTVTAVDSSGHGGQLETWYRLDLEDVLPIPPSHMMMRVTNGTNSGFFLVNALKSYRDYWTEVMRFIPNHESVATLLDWGCGTGRLTAPLLRYSGVPRVFGCDIDREAIDWCTASLPEGTFTVVAPYPPTHFDPETFDVVVSYSVMTHLSRDLQVEWLREVRRILKPGGLFLTSTHGAFAADFNLQDPSLRLRLDQEGILDCIHDPNLDGIAPPGYYRGVFQTRDYTFTHYSRIFEIVAYREAGANNLQDLVVMRKEEAHD